jgi:AraC-like DNA-binding protein
MLAQPVESLLTSEDPLDAVIVDYDQPEPLAVYMHECFEVGVLISGRQEQHYQDWVIQVAPGDMSLIAGWEPHGVRTLEAGTRRLSLYFVPEFLGEESFEGMPWLVLFARRPEERPRVTGSEMREEVLALGKQLIREIEQKKWGWQSAVRLGILQLLLNISRDWNTRDHAPAARVGMSNLARIMSAIRLVHSDHTRRVSRPQAAAVCQLSVSQFSSLFRKTMGISFGRFAIRHRLGHAAQLLLTTDLPVESVAEATGFSHSSHLYRWFVGSYHCTPAEYRQHRNLPPSKRTPG